MSTLPVVMFIFAVPGVADANGMAMEKAEFPNLESCRKAASYIVSGLSARWMRGVSVICVNRDTGDVYEFSISDGR